MLLLRFITILYNMRNQDTQPITIQVVADLSGYKRLYPLQLNYVPAVGDHIGYYNDKKVYQIKHVIHEDIQVVLVVTAADSRLAEALDVAYSTTDE